MTTLDNLTLLPGSMQNWSDLAHRPGSGSAAARDLVRSVLAGAQRVALVGPHAPDLITGLADLVPELTVILRSVPDARTVAELLADNPKARVLACDLTIAGADEKYDLVVALDDLARISSAETDPAEWAQVAAVLTSLVADGGRLVLASENELGLHRMTALRSRFTANEDGDWSPTETFDATRPRDPRELRDALEAAGLGVLAGGEVLPTWDEQTVFLSGATELDEAGHALLGAVTLGSPTFRGVGADPTRLTRAAVLGKRLPQVASAWWLVAGRGGAADKPTPGPRIVASAFDGSVHQFALGADGWTRDGEPFTVPSGALPFGEQLLDACADGDLTVVRGMLQRLAGHVDAHTADGSVPAQYADARPDNLLLAGDDLHPVLPGAQSSREEVLWRALADIVHVVRARGARHPWPSATDDPTMFASLAAMTGVALPEEIEPWLTRAAAAAPANPLTDVSGLIAVVERLTETNKALASRATWYEQRLASTERDLKVRTERHRAQLASSVRQQEVLRGSAEDLRRSLTYRMGNAMLGPVRTLRNRTRDED